MKKLLSILCTLALVLSVVLIPGMFSATAAATDVTVTSFGSKITYKETEGYYELTNGGDWRADTLVTDYEIAADKVYALSFDFSGDTAYFAPQAFVSGGNKLQFAFQKDYRASYTLFQNVSLVFKANDMLKEGVTDKHLRIEFSTVENTPARIKNIKVEEVAFNSNYVYATYINKGMQATGDGSGNVAYKNLTLYSSQNIVLDKKIAADKTYTIEYEYKGKAGFDGGFGWKWTTVSAPDGTAGDPASGATGVNHTYGNVLVSNWTKCSITATGAELGATATRKYLMLAGASIVDSVGCYFRNIKVTEHGVGDGNSSSEGTGSSEPEDTTPGASAKYPLYDEEFIYPTKLSGSATESADDKPSYKWDKDWDKKVGSSTGVFRPTYGWSDSTAKKGVLVFDQTLQANAEYILEFDRWGHYNSGDYVRVGTADASGNADFTKFAQESAQFYAQQWSCYWHDSITFKANDVINGENKRLAIEMSSSAASHLLKNFKLTKITRAKGYQYPVAWGASMAQIAENGGVTYAQTDATNMAWLVFDYKLEAGKTYQVEFDYFGHYAVQAGGWNWSFGAAASTDIAGSTKSDVFNTKSKLVGVPYVSDSHNGLKADKTYKHVSVMLNADDIITDTNKYLVLHSSGYDSMPFLKNFKIQVFEPSGLLPVTLGSETMISVENGDVTVGVTASYSGHSWMKFDYELQPDTEYLFSYDFRGHSYLENDKDTRLSIFAVADPYSEEHPKNEVNFAKQGPILAISNTRTDYTHKVVAFNSNDIIDGDKKYFTIYGQGYPDKWTIKNLVLIVKPEGDGSNLLFNTDFEDKSLGTEFWTSKGVSIDRVETQNHTENGTAALNIKGGNFSNVNQNAIVEKNTDYELSFWYKGKVGNQALVGITRDVAEFSRRYMFAYAVAPSANVENWTKCTITFNSGNREVINVGFLGTADSDYYVDDIVLGPATTAGQYSAETTIKEPYVNYEQKFNRYRHWTAAPGKNLIENGDFEGAIPASWGSFISGSNGVLSIVDGEGYNGDNSSTGGKALKFEAKGLESNAGGHIYIDNLKANTDYVLSYWTRAPYWAADNDADMTHGIANVFDGLQYFTYREEVRGNQVLTQDNRWHRTTIKFNTGSNTRVAYAITGANTTAYIDNLQVFAVSDAVDARPEVMLDAEKNRAYVTDKAPTKIYVGATKNLVRNGNFESATSTFWSSKKSTIGYKHGGGDELYYDKYVTLLDWNGVAEIKDSGTSRGKALYYKSNTGITGYPLGTAYVKYIDVEPNTEYTFVADYVVVKSYNNPGVLGHSAAYKAGDFGIAMVNSLNPIPIASINFYDNYNSNLAWQKMAVTFNTNGYDKVGIYIRDRGGEAYFDNISLFKASDGSTVPVYEPEPPEVDDESSSGSSSSGSTSSGSTSSGGTSSGGGTPVLPPEIIDGEIESDKYTVVGEKGDKRIYGIEPGATVEDVLKTLKSQKNIKVFDAEGNEVTDKSVPVGTGISFRYMDGFSAVDAAIALVRGDINGDGYIDGTDMRILLKKVISPLSVNLSEQQMLVADIDKDGKITSNDVALISAHIGGAKALEPVTVG